MPPGHVTSLDFERAITEVVRDVTHELDRLLPPLPSVEGVLLDAMRYATLQGGKRVRAFLVMESARLFNVAPSCALRVAAALEMIHAYSLVHDDLPAMDNSPWRRGQPSLHCQFDEATAILAGDALLTAAFEVLAEKATHADARVRIDLVKHLAAAAGALGMCGGQMADLLAERQKIAAEIGVVTQVQRLKTGALIGFAATSGAILGKAPPPAKRALQNYAHDLGLAFQIKDDLLDHEGDESLVGKTLRQDQAAGKANFVTLMGAERAREQAALLAEQACHHLDIFAERGGRLQQLAHMAINRSH
ncbi:MAG: polyprenyl synthetase family protein [Candidatus Symbiobacter sp.]|nr:polyprenyl synthetase family protein [Candidatus Symbiobacter sp.]